MTRSMYENDYYRFNRKGEQSLEQFYNLCEMLAEMATNWKFLAPRAPSGSMDASGVVGFGKIHACV